MSDVTETATSLLLGLFPAEDQTKVKRMLSEYEEARRTMMDLFAEHGILQKVKDRPCAFCELLGAKSEPQAV